MIKQKHVAVVVGEGAAAVVIQVSIFSNRGSELS